MEGASRLSFAQRLRVYQDDEAIDLATTVISPEKVKIPVLVDAPVVKLNTAWVLCGHNDEIAPRRVVRSLPSMNGWREKT